MYTRRPVGSAYKTAPKAKTITRACVIIDLVVEALHETDAYVVPSG
jgi:hypothetical protein